MNFDGACKGNPSLSGFGAIIRDELGKMLGAKFGPMGVSTNNIAEVTALEAGLEWCVEKGVHKVLIEGNSAVDCLANMGISISCPKQLSRTDEIPDALVQILNREKLSIPRTGIR
ncbi:hypothetical protein SUGI_0172580 [Cryptomeria japonica]|nr:hypothetical protein SUGI_0172580 [Cryptomeria japonica]